MPRTLAQNAQYIAETIKPAIKSAIEAQGVTVPSTDSFLDYADRIGEIEGGGSGYQLKDLPTGSISSFTDGVDLPLNSLKVSIEAVQSGSGTPSPSNIRPIHGWDSASIYNKSKNLFPMMIDEIKSANTQGTWSGNDYSYGGIIFTLIFDAKNSILGIKLNGRAKSNFKDFLFTGTRVNLATYGLVYGNQYTISGSKSGLTVMLNGGNANIAASESGTTFIATNSDVYVPALRPTSNASFDNVIIYPQIEAGTQATDFAPYCTTYTQTFTDAQGNPLTVYGAEWDVVNGGMKKKEQGLQISQTGWTHNTTYGYHLFLSNTLLNKALNYNYICECYTTKIGARDQLQDGEIGTYNTQSARNIFAIRDDRFDNVTDFMNAMGNYKIKYELTESSQETIQLSPLSIRMLEGTNNLYADCGEVIEGEYFIGSSGAYDLYDYIQSDGTQYINTGRKLSSGDVIRCLYVPQSGNSNWNYVWASYDNSTVKGGLVFISNNIKAQYINGSETNRKSYSDSTYYEDTLTMTADSDGDTYVFSYSADTACCSYMRLYAFSINGDDYLPCKRRSDGKFGLYDVANSQFLTDSASGNAFIGGNNLGVRIG